MDKQVQKLVRAARGWAGRCVEETKKGYMFYAPDPSKGSVLVHKTPSDKRAWKNTIALLRQR